MILPKYICYVICICIYVYVILPKYICYATLLALIKFCSSYLYIFLLFFYFTAAYIRDITLSMKSHISSALRKWTTCIQKVMTDPYEAYSQMSSLIVKPSLIVYANLYRSVLTTDNLYRSVLTTDTKNDMFELKEVRTFFYVL